MDIFYMAIYPENKNVIFNKPWLDRQPSLAPEDKKYADVVCVCEVWAGDLRLLSDIVNQKMICFANK